MDCDLEAANAVELTGGLHSAGLSLLETLNFLQYEWPYGKIGFCCTSYYDPETLPRRIEASDHVGANLGSFTRVKD